MQAERNRKLGREADGSKHANPLATALPLSLALWLGLLIVIFGALRLGS
jgi:hypothetical protein